MCSELPMAPIVARQPAGTRRISPEGSVICAQPASRAISARLMQPPKRARSDAQRTGPAAGGIPVKSTRTTGLSATKFGHAIGTT